MKTKIDKVRKLLDDDTRGLTPKEIAERVGCHVSQVHHEIARRQTAEVPKVDPPKLIKPGTPPALLMEIRLADAPTEIKIRNGSDTMLGTLVLRADGISYRKPDQKSPADRTVRWAVLEKIMQLGIV